MRKLYPLIISSICFMACTKKNTKDEIQDKNLSIQVMKEENEGNGIEYKIRIFYQSKRTDEENRKLTEQMIYRADSSFYKLTKTDKQYADAITPVANGLKNCFEYIVIFNNAAKGMENSLTYQDKYITGKTYQLSLK